jgi:hypothetical protein
MKYFHAGKCRFHVSARQLLACGVMIMLFAFQNGPRPTCRLSAEADIGLG